MAARHTVYCVTTDFPWNMSRVTKTECGYCGLPQQLLWWTCTLSFLIYSQHLDPSLPIRGTRRLRAFRRNVCLNYRPSRGQRFIEPGKHHRGLKPSQRAEHWMEVHVLNKSLTLLGFLWTEALPDQGVRTTSLLSSLLCSNGHKSMSFMTDKCKHKQKLPIHSF